jgi:hypothetical protein
MKLNKLKKLQTYAIVSILILVVFAGIPTSASAKKASGSTSSSDPTTGLSVEVRSEGKGYLILVEGSQDQEVYLIDIDKNGDKSVYEFEFKPAEFRLWISKDIVKNRNELYIVRIHARDELVPDETGSIPALRIDVVKIDIEGRSSDIKLILKPVIKTQLSIDLDLTSGLPPGNDAQDVPLTFSGIKRDTKVLGSSLDSFFDSEYEIKLRGSQPAHHVNSFFDVVYEINFDPPSPGHTGDFDSFFDISYTLKSADFVIDSFFDVSYRNSNKGSEFAIDSFFDITYQFELPSPGLPQGDYLIDSFFDIYTEVNSILPSPIHKGNDIVSAPLSQVVTEMTLELPSPGHTTDPSIPVESFFDVFVDIDLPSPGQTKNGFTVDTLIDVVVSSTSVYEPTQPSSTVEISSLSIYRIDGDKGSTVIQDFNLKSSFEGGLVKNEVNLSKKIDVPIELILPDLFSPGSSDIPIISSGSSIGTRFGLPGSERQPAPQPITDSFFDVFIDIEIEGLNLRNPDIFTPYEFPILDNQTESGFSLRFKGKYYTEQLTHGFSPGEKGYTTKIGIRQSVETSDDDTGNNALDSFFDVFAHESYSEKVILVPPHSGEPGLDVFISNLDLSTDLNFIITKDGGNSGGNGNSNGRGITINTAHVEYDSRGRQTSQVNLPGNEEINMVTGEAQSHGTILVVSVPDEPMPQTKEHILLARQIGTPNAVPFPSFGGRETEDSSQFYKRVSERLRHKERAITIFDYERLVLESFPSIYKVKCVNHAGEKDICDIEGTTFAVDSFFDVNAKIEVGPILGPRISPAVSDDIKTESNSESDLRIDSIEPFFALENNESYDNKVTVAGYDYFHKLTRGTNSRSWGETKDMDIISSKMTLESSNQVVDELKGSGNNADAILIFIDSFFDVYSELDFNTNEDGMFMAKHDSEMSIIQKIRIVAPIGGSWGDELKLFEANTSTSNQVSKVVVRGWDPVTKSGVTKASVESSSNSSAEIDVLYNPKEIKIQKTVPWQEHNKTGRDTPKLEWTSGETMQSSFELFFDTYGNGKNVKEHAIKVHSLAHIDSNKTKPPTLSFVWGQSMNFTSYLTKLDVKYTKFNPDGIPIRSKVQLTLDESMFLHYSARQDGAPSEANGDIKANSHSTAYVQGNVGGGLMRPEFRVFTFDVFSELTIHDDAETGNDNEVQYNKTDFNSVSRLLQDGGMYLFNVDSFFDALIEVSPLTPNTVDPKGFSLKIDQYHKYTNFLNQSVHSSSSTLSFLVEEVEVLLASIERAYNGIRSNILKEPRIESISRNDPSGSPHDGLPGVAF